MGDHNLGEFSFPFSEREEFALLGLGRTMHFAARSHFKDGHDSFYKKEFPAARYSWFQIVTVGEQDVPGLDRGQGPFLDGSLWSPCSWRGRWEVREAWDLGGVWRGWGWKCLMEYWTLDWEGVHENALEPALQVV